MLQEEGAFPNVSPSWENFPYQNCLGDKVGSQPWAWLWAPVALSKGTTHPCGFIMGLHPFILCRF